MDVLVGTDIVHRTGERAEERVVVAVRGRAIEDNDSDPALLLQSDRHSEPDNLIEEPKPGTGIAYADDDHPRRPAQGPLRHHVRAPQPGDRTTSRRSPGDRRRPPAH